jgi:ATP-dependent protease ClpP protease subunit
MARSTRHGALVDALVMRMHGWRNAHPPQVTEPDAAGRTWYRIENKADGGGGPATIHLYDEIGAWGISADMFMSDLAELGSRDLLLRVNSPGGEVFDGVAIYNSLQRHGGRITAHVDGLAASAASFIAMAADELVMEPGSQMMIHDAQGMCWGNEADARALADMLGRTSGTIALIYAERAGGTAEEWRALMRAETWYDGAGAVAAKLADRVGESRQRDREDKAPPSNRAGDVVPPPVLDYDAGQPRDPNSGRWTDGMPDAIASYAFSTTAGALTAVRTREGVELSDGANTVTLSVNERRRIERAMGNSYAEGDTLINRYVERDGVLHAVAVARVRPQGRGESEDGESVVAGMRLDIGEVEDSDDYDSRTGVIFTARQADEPFAATLGQAEVSARVQTGYGPLDMFPTPDGRGMALRMKAEGGDPTEVSFSGAEWSRINAAINTLIDGFDETTPEGREVNAITVTTKAGKVDLEWKGSRQDDGYAPDSRLLITPQYDAPWSVVIDGEHMAGAFDPIGMINDAIGVSNIWRPRMRRRPERRPLAFRGRPHVENFEGQPRDDEGRWAEFPGTGIEWSRYTEIYDVYDETQTRSGLTVATMSGGDMQFAWDDADEPGVRHVMIDFAADDNGPAELRDALREAVDSTVQQDWELIDDDNPTEIWANVSREAESIKLFVPGIVEKNDFEIEIDLDEAEELIDALDTQIGNYNDLVDRGQVSATWAGLVRAYCGATPPTFTVGVLDDAWTVPEWADAHTTIEPVSSPADDHGVPWEAYA